MHQSPRRHRAWKLIALIVGLNFAFGSAALLGLALQPAALARPAVEPLPPEDQAILDQVAELLGEDGAGLTAVPGPNGMRIIDMHGRSQAVLLSRVAADGAIVLRCVTTLEEARAFLAGEDPATAAALLGLEPHPAEEFVAQDHPSLAQLLASTQTEIVIVNFDGPGQGFNDPTPAAPVGGNPGTTVGQQRLFAFQYAAAIWANALQTTLPIRIGASFGPLTCSSNSAVLGSAGPANFVSFPPGTQLPPGALTDTLYPIALGEKLIGEELDPGAPDIFANFNGNLGQPGCLEGRGWYYGFDGNEGGGTDLVVTLLHEFAHGLGFISVVDETTGENLEGENDIWNSFLFDNVINQLWKNMNPEQRLPSITGVDRLVWAGAAVRAEAPYELGAVPVLNVTAPVDLTGTFDLSAAQFGGRVPVAPLGAAVVAADPADACSLLSNSADVAGAIVLADLDGCEPVVKARNAQAAGAVALLIADTADDTEPPALPGTAADVRIPVLGITRELGEDLRPAAEAGDLEAEIGLDLSQMQGVDSQGRLRLYTPGQLRPGSSVSHFDDRAFPNLLMEFRINPDIGQSLDLTDELMRDIGWFPDKNYNKVDDRTEPNVSIWQSVTPSGLLPVGSAITLIVTVQNQADAVATPVRLVDTFPARLGDVSWKAVYAGGASGPANGNGNIDAALNLPAGSSAVFTISAVLEPGDGPADIINVASLVLSGSNADVDPSDNSASISIPVAAERLMLPLLRRDPVDEQE